MKSAQKQPGAVTRTRTGGPQSPPAKPALAKVINTFKCAIEKLQLAQGLETEKARQLTLDHYIGQVELLQTAFTSLADAVLEELDALGTERVRAQHEQATHLQNLRDLEDRVQAKYNQLSRLEERLDVKLAIAAQLPGQFETLAKQQHAGDVAIEGLKKDNKRLLLQLSQLEHQQSLAASEAAVATLNPFQRSQVKECVQDQVQQLVPNLVTGGIATHVPPLIDEAVEAASRTLHLDMSSTTELLANDMGRVSKEVAAVRADVSSLAGSLQQQVHEMGVLQPRVARLTTTLEAKVDELAAQQARYSKSVEGVVGALVDDTVSLNKATRQVEGLVKHQQVQLQDTKEALLRSAKVFSQLLKIPSPVSTTLWSGTSPMPGSLAATAAATAAASAYSPHSSPVKAPMGSASAAGSPGYMSKYAALLHGLS